MLADYVAARGLASRGLRDEILVQLCNQVGGAPARVLRLLAHCLAAFQPGPALHKYVYGCIILFITYYLDRDRKDLVLRHIFINCSQL